MFHRNEFFHKVSAIALIIFSFSGCAELERAFEIADAVIKVADAVGIVEESPKYRDAPYKLGQMNLDIYNKSGHGMNVTIVITNKAGRRNVIRRRLSSGGKTSVRVKHGCSWYVSSSNQQERGVAKGPSESVILWK